MSYFKPQVLTPFQRKKVQEIARCDKQGINPLTVAVEDGGAGYSYTADDIRNYYESINRNYTITI
jgi:hypothetical protein